LIHTCQNRFVFQRIEWVDAGDSRRVRNWPSPQDLRRIFAPHFGVEVLGTIRPGGSLGVLRVINSPKLNRWVGMFVGRDRLDRVKERAGLGQFIVLDAVRRSGDDAR
jgi:hypothetical protein